MEDGKQIQPEKITKPIQLLAAWLVGLIIVNGSFLAAAAHISSPTWIPPALVCASIFNVPLFLVAIFLLQTKFRPEMQEDSFYSQYLDRKTGHTRREVTAESVAILREEVAKIEAKVATVSPVSSTVVAKKFSWAAVTVMLNKKLKDFAPLAKSLSRHGIPVHELFGDKADTPDILKIALGKGFSVAQLRALIDVLADYPEGWIYYADDDYEEDQYAGQLLIGAYGAYKHGVQIAQAKALFEETGLTESSMYRFLGLRESTRAE